MKRYKYFSVGRPGDSLGLVSTDTQTVEWVLDELKKTFPSREFAFTAKDFTGKIFACNIKIKNSHITYYTVMYWIIQQLGQQGWEPFDVEEGTVHMRFEEEV